MRGTVHHAVPAAVLEALLDWLPQAEHAMSLRDVASAAIEVGDGGAPVAVALVVEGRPTLSGAEVVAACAGRETAADALVRMLVPRASSAGRLELSGPAALARPVAQGVAAAVDGTCEVVMEQRLMAASDVEHPVGVRGAARPVRAGDRRLVAEWLDDFAVEALGAAPRGTDHWAERLEDPAWRLWVWEVDGTPVSVVNGRRTTPVSARIGPVYTPPGHRGHGWAGALTAHVTAALLAAGHERVTLFTDQANPTSNAMYLRLGYQDVGAHGSWLVTVVEAAP